MSESPTQISGITRDEVAHLARLARLALDDDELDRLGGQLGALADR
jgi:aspartyl-tRNA(Asn)/glutamyl-tRNA(Gln) amidotransferase subunit C